MRTPRSQLKKTGNAPLVQFEVYAQRRFKHVTPASPEGTLFHMQAIKAVDKAAAKAAYYKEWPGSEVIRVFGPDDPLEFQSKKTSK